MTHRATAAHCLLAAALLGAVAGCSFSASSESISKSVSSPFTSSSRSSGSDDDASYKEDVRDATAAHVLSGGDAAALRERIAALAKEHGISNWEASKSTYIAVGAGLAKAKYRQVEVDAFKDNLTTSEEQRNWVQKGYDDAH